MDKFLSKKLDFPTKSRTLEGSGGQMNVDGMAEMGGGGVAPLGQIGLRVTALVALNQPPSAV